MSDWQVGDLAVCVDENDYDGSPLGITIGAIYTVADVFEGYDLNADQLTLALELAERPPCGDHDGFDAACFRKIRPDEHESCEPEFVTLLKRGKVSA